MTPYEQLTEAQKLIQDPKNWTKGAGARNIHNEITGTLSDDAVCWCAIGALDKISGNGRAHSQTYGALYYWLEKMDIHSIAIFNDSISTSHEDVMELFDNARELAKEWES